MALPNIFSKEIADSTIYRINNLKHDSIPSWGKMNSSQMLAHVNVAYEMTFENNHKKPNFLVRLLLKKFVKNGVVNEIPYPKNSKTAPQFIITDERDFEAEKSRLISYIYKCVELGEDYFEGKESLSFGAMNKTEWNNQFYKHLDHHLKQFNC